MDCKKMSHCARRPPADILPRTEEAPRGIAMNNPNTVVLIIDDDPAALHWLEHTLEKAGYRIQIFSSKTNLYASFIEPNSARCAIIDLHLAGRTGLQVQAALEHRFPDIPVIFISGEGDVPSTVQAMKAGAADFLVKPLDEEVVLESVRRALDKDRSSQNERNELMELGRRFNSLTPREHEVLELVVSGRLNKQVGAELGTSEKTVKVHRARIMRKMGVQSLAQLVQLIIRLRSASGAMTGSPRPGAVSRGMTS